MIPYFELKTIELGPLTIYVWGLFVALGIVAGLLISRWFAKKKGLDPKIISDLTGWVVLAGVVGARLFHVLFYDLGTYIENPFSVFYIWEGGMSIFGGFFGAVIVGVWYLKYKKLQVLSYVDAVVFGLPWGLFVGRIGCFLIHDHPGIQTDFFLGVLYPDGIIRHDHGLYLSLLGLAIGLWFLRSIKMKTPAGYYAAMFTLFYGIFRIQIDELRLLDVTYWGFTPGQYFSLLIVLLGIFMFGWINRDKINAGRRLTNKDNRL